MSDVIKHTGYLLLAGGAVLQVTETMTKASANASNQPFAATTVGKLVTPLEGVLPFSLGWTLIAAGAILVGYCYLAYEVRT